MITKIMKRDRTIVDFDATYIYEAVKKAAREVYVLDDALLEKLAAITKNAVLDLAASETDGLTSINSVQAAVERRLIADGYVKIAESYIRYRIQREIDRANLPVTVRLKLENEISED